MVARGVREGWRALCAGLLVWVASALPIAEVASGTSVDADRKQIVGWLERIRILPSNELVRAKLDTGAKTSSIHAEEIERFEREGQPWVRYTLVLKETRTRVHRVRGESPVVRRVFIKEHETRPDARPVVELEFCLDGLRHRAQFSLVDRSAFFYSVLLGRDFLAGSYIVDPDATFLTGAPCDPETEAP